MPMIDSIHRGRCFLKGFFSVALLIISGIAWVVRCSNVCAASDLSESQLLQLENGEVLVGVQQTGQASGGMVEATILIDAPAESVWQVMVNCPDSPTFVPGLVACRVLESGENWEIIRQEVKWTWFLPKLSYVFRAIYQAHKQIDFVRIEGDLRDMKGTWRLIPFDQGRRTLVRYSVFLDPGFFIPQWVVRQALKADLPAVLRALRTKVLSKRSER
jgi:ribosome-associated toxin RatA of RatAB toxin-antitoxin module